MEDADALIQARTAAIAVVTTTVTDGPVNGWIMYLQRAREMAEEMDDDMTRALVAMSGGIFNLCHNLVTMTAKIGGVPEQRVLQDIATIIAQKDAGL